MLKQNVLTVYVKKYECLQLQLILLYLSHRVIVDKNLLYTLLSRGKIYKKEKAMYIY